MTPLASIGWPYIIPLLGAGQGALLALALANKPANRTANRLLAATMATLVVHLASVAYQGAHLVAVFPHFFGVAYPMGFLHGPLVYLYAICASERSRRLVRRDALHLLPFVACVVALLPIYMMSAGAKVATYHAMQRGVLPWQVTVTSPLKMVSGIVYSAATVLFLRRHRASMDDNYSSVERVSLRWVQWLVLSAACIWAVGMAFDIAEPFGVVPAMLPGTVIAILMTLVVIGTGYMGLRQPEIFHFDGRALAPAPAAALSLETEPTDPASAPAARYERSGLTARQRVTLERRLVECMERDRPWLDADLTLADLAGRLGTSPHKLSEVLSSQVKQSFFDFVNGYRVREVQRRLLTPDAGRLTFLTLALDAGFSAKSTFNVVFKKHTGLTPSAFRAGLGAGAPAETPPA